MYTRYSFRLGLLRVGHLEPWLLLHWGYIEWHHDYVRWGCVRAPLWLCLVVQSCPTLATPKTVACQVPLSMGFSRQEYWSGLPFPLPGDLPNPEIEPGSPVSQADSLLIELQGKPLSRYGYVMVIFWLLLWLLHQPGERLCYGCLVSQGRLNCVCSSYGSLSLLPASELVPCLPWIQWTIVQTVWTARQLA